MQTRLNEANVNNLNAQSAKNYADTEKSYAEARQTMIDNANRLEYRLNELDLQQAEIFKAQQDGKISESEAKKRADILDKQIEHVLDVPVQQVCSH